MSPRPPPKISLKHEWKRKLGSEVARQAKIVQPTQPTPNPIRDRSERPDNKQDGRNTSRSQEINVNSFCEELGSSDRTGRLVETEIVQTRSSEDSKSLNVEQTHDRTGRPVATLHTAEAQDSSRVRSAHESDTFNVDDEVLRKRMENSIADHDESHESMMVNEADMDFRIPGQPHSVVKHAQSTSVRQLIQKIENHQDRHALRQDLRQNQSFNPFSPESKQIWEHWIMWITRDGTQNAVHSMFIIVEHWYTLLHVRAFIAQRKRGESAIHQLYDGPSFSSGARHQERTTSWTSIW